MRHRVFGRKLGRDTKERKALFKGLISALILKGKIVTTEAKAKSIKGQVDKFVTKAKKGSLFERRQLLAFLNKEAVVKLLDEVAPRFSQRSSGFTQLIKLGSRKGDGAPMVLMQWVGLEEKAETSPLEEKKKKDTSVKELPEAKKEEKKNSSKKKKKETNS